MNSVTTLPEYLLVLTTCGSEEEAAKIAETLVTQHAAACCNILPGLHSIFVWRGTLEREREVLLLIKTTAGAFTRVQETIARLHSYEIPEIIALPIIDGAEDYLRWVAEQTKP